MNYDDELHAAWVKQAQELVKEWGDADPGREVAQAWKALTLHLWNRPASMDAGDGMTEIAEKYAHRMAMHLECILLDSYGGRFYDEAMQTLGNYRSEMNAIHEAESPTFMGEPMTPNVGDEVRPQGVTLD